MPSIRPTETAVASRAERALVVLATAGLFVLPFVFTMGLEFFRAAKEAAMRTQAIVGLFILAVAVLYGGTARLREMLRQREVVAIVAGAVLWTVITTLTSNHRLLSIDSLVSVVFAALLFVCIWYAAPRVPIAALAALVPGVIVNTILVTLQEYDVWNPFSFGIVKEGHLAASGLLGNPNEVGAYLALCAIVLLVVSEFQHGAMRWVSAIASAVALTGVFVSQTRTAVLAIGVALIIMAVRRSFKAALVIALVLAVSLLIATRMRVPALTRLVEIPAQVAAGQWNVVFSERLPPFLAAIEMFRDHPFLGTGPGTYKFFFMPYRILLKDRYPAALLQASGTNFAETHNDHLQLLAETGLPGYLLFVAACGALLWISKRRRETASDQARFASELSLPFVAAVFVLALAFFPLHVALTRHLLVTLAALLAGWSRT